MHSQYNVNYFLHIHKTSTRLTDFHRTSTDSVVGISTAPYAHGTIAVTLTRSLRLRGFLINTSGAKVRSVFNRIGVFMSVFLFPANITVIYCISI